MHSYVRLVHPTQIRASQILKDEDRNIGGSFSIRHHSFVHDLLSIPWEFYKQISDILSSLLMTNGHMRYLVGVINHFTRLEASEATSKIVPFRVRREQGRIKSMWIGNIML